MSSLLQDFFWLHLKQGGHIMLKSGSVLVLIAALLLHTKAKLFILVYISI